MLSSSRGDQLSYEDDDAKHGLFTKAVIDALDSRGGDGLLTREQLFELVSTAVSRETDGAQTPIIDRDNPLIDLALPKF